MKDLFSVTWGYDVLYLWCSECPGDESDDGEVWSSFGNPTPFADLMEAATAHALRHARQEGAT